MPYTESNQWVCAGTKRISIAEDYSPTPADGMISVYCRPPPSDDDATGDGKRSPATGRLSSGSSSGDDCLHVVITDGVNTFYRSIGLQEIRHMGNEEGLLEKVASILLRPDDTTFKVSYKRIEGQLLGGSQDSKNTTSVNMLVRKTHLNNLVRPIWDDHLNDICHAFHDDLPLFARNALVMHEGIRHSKSESPSSTSGLAFSVMMGDTINKLHKEIETLRTQNKQLETNTLRWKSTSEKLSNQWESEKSELTDRFLTLFNDHKARHIETQKELDQLKGRTQQRTTERGTRGAGTLSNRSNIRKSFEPLPDHEDEHDYAKYSSSFVDRLAAGPSTMKRRANDRDPMGGVSQKQKRQDSQSQESGFVNPHTGAMEFGNAKDMFSSSDEEEGGGMKG